MTDKAYNGLPGFKPGAPETSREAAVAIAVVATSIRARVLAAITDADERGLTGDQVASRCDLSVYQVRSRIAELGAAKVVVDSKRRDRLDSGLNGAVWVLREYGPAEPDDGQGDLLAA